MADFQICISVPLTSKQASIICYLHITIYLAKGNTEKPLWSRKLQLRMINSFGRNG